MFRVSRIHYFFFLFFLFLVSCSKNPDGSGPTPLTPQSGQNSIPNLPSLGTGSSGNKPLPPPFSTVQTLESQFHDLAMISSLDTEYSDDLVHHSLLPKGSAYITDSGNLRKAGVKANLGKGMNAVIHAVIGSTHLIGRRYEITPDSIQLAVENSVHLAKRYGFKEIAIPFIGEDLADSMHIAKIDLLERIMEGALNKGTNLQLVFVVNPGLQRNAEYLLGHLLTAYHMPLGSAMVKGGTIIRYSLHNAPVIVSPAMMEGTFSPQAVAQDIADETLHKKEIEQEAKIYIDKFKANLSNGIKTAGKYSWIPIREKLSGAVPSLKRMDIHSAPKEKLSCDQVPFLCIPDDFTNFTGNNLQVEIGPSSIGDFSTLSNDYSNHCSRFYGHPGNHFHNEEAVVRFLVSVATPSPQVRYFYRYGREETESARIGIVPPFDLKYITNYGLMVGGKGIYVAEDPIASQGYAEAGHTLVTYVVPAGSPILMLDDPATRNRISVGLGIPLGEVNNVIMQCNPPVQVGHYLGTWWSLKDNHGVVVEDFDARYRPDPTADYLLLGNGAARAIYLNKCNPRVLMPGAVCP